MKKQCKREQEGQRAFKSKCKRRPLGIAGLTFTVVLVAMQLIVLDLYFILYGDENPSKFFSGPDDIRNCTLIGREQQRYYSWHYLKYFVLPDLMAIAAMAYIPAAAIWQLRRERARGYVKTEKVDASLKHASICWCLYSLVISCKIAISGKGYLKVLQHLEQCGVNEILGVNSFILTLTGTCIIFFTLTFSHHAHDDRVDDWLKLLVEVVTFDLVDGVHFLQIIFTHGAVEFMFLHPSLENLIILLACINFVLPAASLLSLTRKLESEHTEEPRLKSNAIEDLVVAGKESALYGMPKGISPDHLEDKIPKPKPELSATESQYQKEPKHCSLQPRRRLRKLWFCLTMIVSEQHYSLAFLLLINLPYFVVRCYMWHIAQMELSVFIVKNGIAIIIECTKTVHTVREVVNSEM